jgi:cytochrome P450
LDPASREPNTAARSSCRIPWAISRRATASAARSSGHALPGADWVTIAGIEANDFFWQNLSNWSYEQAGPGFTDQFGPTYVTQLDGAPAPQEAPAPEGGFSAEAVGRYVRTMAVETGRFLGTAVPGATTPTSGSPPSCSTLNKATVLQTELSTEEMRDAIRLEAELIYGVSVSAAPAEHFARPGYAERKARVFAWWTGCSRARRTACAPDNLQQMIEQDPGNLEPLSQEELRNDAYMLLVAGIHNTTRLLTRILERISLDPEWVEELRAELAAIHARVVRPRHGAFPS